VIAFDQRGITNTIVGSKPYTPQALANDTAGLLDALKIPKADVMRYSLRSFLAQHLATDTGRPTCIFYVQLENELNLHKSRLQDINQQIIK